MSKIKISIVMPCLNSKKYIRQAIDSIRNQTLEEWELIVVDAGSDDGTEMIIKEYQLEDPRIIFLHSDKKSMEYQYNLGILRAIGKYIGFVEADDYIHFEMYQKLFAMAEEQELDFIKSDFDMFITDKKEPIFLNYSVLSSKREKKYGIVLQPVNDSEILYRDVNMWNGIYRREFLLDNEVILNETAGAAFQDIGFVLKSFLSASKVMYIHIPSYYYRKDNINASVYNRSKHVQFVMDEFYFIWNYMKQRKIDVPFRAIIMKRFWGMFCSYYDYFQFHGQLNLQIQENINRFLMDFSICCQELNYDEIRGEMLDTSLSFGLMQSNHDFKSVRKYIDASERKIKSDFYQKVQNRQLIIFGSGEYGTALYAFLRRNGIKTVLCFCDNDTTKTGKKLMGIDCILPNQILERYRERIQKILFLIANETYYIEMSKQLQQMGINHENIIRSITILPHNAFELSMEEK